MEEPELAVGRAAGLQRRLELYPTRVAWLVPAPLLGKRRKAGRTTRLDALLSAGDLSGVRAELAERPDRVCLGTLGEAGVNQPPGARSRNLAWLRRN